MLGGGPKMYSCLVTVIASTSSMTNVLSVSAPELIDSEKRSSLLCASPDVTSRSVPSPIRRVALPEAFAKPWMVKSGAQT